MDRLVDQRATARVRGACARPEGRASRSARRRTRSSTEPTDPMAPDRTSSRAARTTRCERRLKPTTAFTAGRPMPLDQGVCLVEGEGQRLLDEHVLAGIDRRDRRPPREPRSARRRPPPPRRGPPRARGARVAARDPEALSPRARRAASSRSATASTLQLGQPHERRQVPVLGREAASHESDAYGPHLGQSRMDRGDPCRLYLRSIVRPPRTVLEDPAGGGHSLGSASSARDADRGGSPTCSARSCWPTSGALRPRPAAGGQVAASSPFALVGVYLLLVALVLDRPGRGARASASPAPWCRSSWS